METNDHPLLYYRSVGSLQSTVSRKIATILWHHLIHNAGSEIRLSLGWLKDQEPNINDIQPLPKVIDDKIGKSFSEFRYKLIRLIMLNYMCLDHDTLIRCIDCISFGNDRKTRRQLLDSDKLPFEEKYIDCECCFKDDIERLWALVSDTDTANIWCMDDFEKLIYFCTCKMMDEDPERIHGSSNKLNAAKTYRLLETRAGFIVGILAMNPDYFDCAAQIWCHFCEYASEVQVYQSLKDFFTLAFCSEHVLADYKQYVIRHDLLYVSEAFTELWIQTPDKFKTTVMCAESIEEFFDLLDSAKEKSWLKYGCFAVRDMDFLLDIVKYLSLPERNDLWRRYWRRLIFIARPPCLQQFMELCFENDQDITTFKHTEMMNFEKLPLGELDEFFPCFDDTFERFSNYIDFCSTDQLRRDKMRQQIVDLCFNAYCGDRYIMITVDDFAKFVEKTFSSPEASKQFLNEYVLASGKEFVQYIQPFADYNYDDFSVPLFVSHFSSDLFSDQTKSNLLNYCRSQFVKYGVRTFEIDLWQNLITACVASEEAAAQFKRSLPVDGIFETTFHYILEQYYIESELRILGDFLLWYFDCEEAVRKYKLSQFQSDKFRRYLLKIFALSMRDAKEVDVAVKWLCEGDTAQIDEFKSVCTTPETLRRSYYDCD